MECPISRRICKLNLHTLVLSVSHALILGCGVGWPSHPPSIIYLGHFQQWSFFCINQMMGKFL